MEPSYHLAGPTRTGPGLFVVGACPVAGIDPATGSVEWEVEGPCGVRLPPRFIVLGDVAVAAAAGLYAVDARTGTTLWNRTDALNGAVIGDAESVYASDGEDLVAYDLWTGEERWRTALEPGGRVNLGAGAGVVCAERLISPPGRGWIECFSIADGSRRWAREVGGAAWLEVTDSVVVVAGGDREYETGWVGLDPATGETRWRRSGEFPTSDPAMSPDGNVLYACGLRGDAAGTCLAIRAADGAVLWVHETDQAVHGDPILWNESLLVIGSSDDASGLTQSVVLVLDRTTGAERSRLRPPPPMSALSSSIAVVDDVLFLDGCCSYRAGIRLAR